jgi:hypothetical protein
MEFEIPTLRRMAQPILRRFFCAMTDPKEIQEVIAVPFRSCRLFVASRSANGDS